MAILTREAIREAQDRPVVEVEVPEWGGSVLVRRFDALTWSRLAERVSSAEGDMEVRVLMCAACLVDDNGELLFDPSSEEDLGLLRGKSFEAIRRVSDEAIAINRIREEDRETFEENFTRIPSAGSVSG